MSATTPHSSRRTFLKSSALLAVGALAAGRTLAAVLEAKSGIALVVLPDDALAKAVPPTWALGELQRALEAQGSAVRLVARLADVAAQEFAVVVSSMSAPFAQTILASKKIQPPVEPESLCLVETEFEKRSVLLVAGTDALGLVYALTELADRVTCLATGRAALEFKQPVIERPASRVRSAMRGFHSEIEDKAWFYDRDFWRAYLTMLVSSRFNRVSFVTGMSYNAAGKINDGYFTFPYPFLVTVPGYQVNAKGLGDDERARNLEMLKFIGEEAVRRGLRFQLGIWTVAYRWKDSPAATYVTEGLTDDIHPAYCRDALAVLLREVPTISGVTFRVHYESGLPRGETDFWKTQFAGVAGCGRRVEIDMHAKGMEPETLAHAQATGQPVVTSPKYCGEQLSLPYHQAAIRERERIMPPYAELTDTGSGLLLGNRFFTRYGYADMLSENRDWEVVFRIWPGAQRFLLCADPATFAGYGRNASFCGAGGIEISEPLFFKGRQGTGQPGGRCAYADESLAPRYEFEKYLYTYRLWGRLGYNPDANPEVWRRALRRDFGSAALAVENALAAASRVLPLFTTAHAPSADCQTFWPEIYANMPIADTSVKQPYWDADKPALFGNVSPFDPQLFQSPDECGSALVAGQVTGKYSPLEVAQWLDAIAATVAAELNSARGQLGAAATQPAFRRVEEDVLILRGLALFFAGKLRCGVLWRIHKLTGGIPAAEAAIAAFVAGRDAWATMAERAKKVYRPDIGYGQSPMNRGHWQDRIQDMDNDIADLRRRLASPVPPAVPVDPTARERALKIATSRPARPDLRARHTPASHFQAGQPLGVTLLMSDVKPLRVTLHYRHVNQAERWESVPLSANGESFSGEIPAAYAASRFPLQYYFEVQTAPATATLFPPLAPDLANVPYYVVRRAT